MSTQPTSALTFGDLILETALKMGVPYYGADGTEEPQVPVDPHDLSVCKRVVNNAIRMFVADAPPSGWRWMRPTQSFVLWPTIAADASRTVTAGAFDSANSETPLTANSAVFFETMEDKDILIKNIEVSPGTFEDQTFRIKRYTSPTVVVLAGDASAALDAHQYSITANGDYTLPRDFGGPHGGPITFGPDTNHYTTVEWSDESAVRSMRSVTSDTTGFPIAIAVKLADSVQTGDRRRYVLATYPTPHSQFTVQFKYNIHFDKLVDVGESPPSPVVHDETLRAACRAVVERDINREIDGPDWLYYTGKRLPASKDADSRSGPRRLGYFGNPDRHDSRHDRHPFRRPNVTFNTDTP